MIASRQRLLPPAALDWTVGERRGGPAWNASLPRRLLLLLAVWSAPGLLLTGQSYLEGSVRSVPVLRDWPVVLAYFVPLFWIWVLFTPIIALLARRFPLVGEHRMRSLLAHIPMSVVMAALDLLYVAARVEMAYPARTEALGILGRALALAIAPCVWVRLLTYWVTLGVVTAVQAYRGLREREVRNAELEASLCRARLEALQSQVQPHFLFNALNALGTLILKDDRERALAFLHDLGDLLSDSLRGAGSLERTVGDEVAAIERYLSVEKVRFADRLRYRLEVDPATLSCYLPTLILQPLVENALRHGVGPRREGGQVSLRVARAGAFLDMAIDDDGVGLAPGWDRADCQGLGIANTRARLAELYGEAARLELAARSGRGTRARVVLPLRCQPGEGGES